MDAPIGGRIFVAGHTGLVGSALCRQLRSRGVSDILTVSRRELDLRDARAVRRWLDAQRPDQVYMAAGTVGGIMANATRPADFIYDNLAMQTAVLHGAHEAGVGSVLMLGSSCIYPRECPQPIREESLLSGPLEPTNAPYAVSKIAAVVMARAYASQYGLQVVTVMPCNLYGPEDNFDPRTSHVLPALIHNLHNAKMAGQPDVTVWGTGTPRREFLHVDDLARACLLLMQQGTSAGPINVGTGDDVTVRELAEVVRAVVYPDARLSFDGRTADGTPRKVLDVSRIRALGWEPRITLADGIRETYRWFLERISRGAWPRGTAPAAQ